MAFDALPHQGALCDEKQNAAGGSENQAGSIWEEAVLADVRQSEGLAGND